VGTSPGKSGQQLVTGNSDIDGEFQLFSDPFPDLVRYFVWPAKQVNGFCHVQKGLIDAEFLDIRGIFGKQVQHLSGITGVNIKAGGHDDEFRKLAFQFIEQYKSNQSKIQRKGIIERYFEDTKPLKVQIDDYVQKDHDAAALRTEMILYVKALQRELKRLETEIAAGQEKIDQIKREQRRIVYEKLSYGIYIDEDRKTALLANTAGDGDHRADLSEKSVDTGDRPV